MKHVLILACLGFGCAQPSAAQDGGIGGKPRPDGALPLETLDLAMAPDLATPPPPDLAMEEIDLATPGPDLRGIDLSMADLVPPPDLAPPPPDLCMPVENCFNNSDDDCNGVVNNGCPDTIVVGTGVPLTAYGGGGGGAGQALCPAGKVAVAMDNYLDYDSSHMAGVGIYCSTPTLVRGASSYSVSLGPQGPEIYSRGGGWDDWDPDNCDPSQFDVMWNTETYTGTFVNGIVWDCARGTLTFSPATKQLTLTFSNLNNNFGGSFPGGTYHAQPCPSSSALVGYKTRVGSYMDQVQPVCAPLTFTYKP